MTPALPDQRFLATRSLVLELAAALDRIERHAAADPAALAADPRWQTLQTAVERLTAGADRAEAVQELFSSPYDPAWRRDGGPQLSGAGGCCGR